MKYVILRETTEATDRLGRPRGGTRAGTATISSPVMPEVEVEELKPHRVASLAHKKEILSVAPVIPMKLIARVRAQASAAPTASGPTWGVQAVGADTSPFSGESIVMSVLDTGIDISHPAFTGVDIVRKNFTTESDDDEHGHGTHCAGTIFGRDVAGIRIGVAPGISKVLIGKVLGSGGGSGSDQIVQAIQWAVNEGANVISMSLGIDFPGYVKELETDGFPTELATSMALEGYRANVLLFERLASFIAAQNAFIQAALLIAAAEMRASETWTQNSRSQSVHPRSPMGFCRWQPSVRPRKASLSRPSAMSGRASRGPAWGSIPQNWAAASC
jgi:subtilase family protein